MELNPNASLSVRFEHALFLEGRQRLGAAGEAPRFDRDTNWISARRYSPI